jgi:hypothetical protein
MGPRSIERGNERLRLSLTNPDLASTGPRLRENERVGSTSLSYFAHAIQKLLDQPVRVENFGVLEGLDKWFHFANRAGAFAFGENSKGANWGEIHADSHLPCWQIVEQKRKALRLRRDSRAELPKLGLPSPGRQQSNLLEPVSICGLALR